MSGWDSFLIVGFISVGGVIGAALAVFGAAFIGFLGDVHWSWQAGRDLAQLVTEKQHKRRLEMLTKMIELERAMLKEAETKTQGDIDAAGKTEEASKVCAVALAALNAAHPKEPISPMAMAVMKRDDV